MRSKLKRYEGSAYELGESLKPNAEKVMGTKEAKAPLISKLLSKASPAETIEPDGMAALKVFLFPNVKKLALPENLRFTFKFSKRRYSGRTTAI